MQTVEMPNGTPVGFEEILTDIQRLDNQSLVAFAVEINRLVAHRNNGQQPNQKEAILLKKIKATIPPSVKRRQKQLYANMQEGTLTNLEREELLLLNSMIEEKTAERISLMGQLAMLRHISIEELYSQLNSKIATHG